MGRLGERFAADYLAGKGLTFVARNVRVDGGEIDLLMLDGRERVAVEVRTITGDTDPIDAIVWAKRRRVGRLAARAGASRADYLGVGLLPESIVVHWLPGCG